MPHQIIYSSQCPVPLALPELEQILGHARRKNAAQGVTGALVYVEGFFLQILEGEQARVQALMQRISADPRHEAVTVLREDDVPAPVFADWRMAYISATPEQVALWAGLDGATALPEILQDLERDPSRVADVARSVLAFLAAGEPAR